jgi:hypothetical protein
LLHAITGIHRPGFIRICPHVGKGSRLLIRCRWIIAEMVVICDNPFMRSKKLIFVLGLIALVMGFGVVFKKIPLPLPNMPQNALSSPTPIPKTGTFVDSLLGRFVFYANGHFLEMMLPYREVQQIGGMTDKKVMTFPAVKPAWSSDGTLFALAVDESTISVVTYKTGELIHSVSVDPKLLIDNHVELSFSPDAQYLVIREGKGKQRLRFYEVSSGKFLQEVSACTPASTWLPDHFYAVDCTENEIQQIILVDPSSGKEMLTKNTYELVSIYDPSHLLVKKGSSVGSLDFDGKFTLIDPKKYEHIASIDDFKDPLMALARRIQETKKTESIDDIDVSSDSTFAIFHTQKGIWIVDVKIKNDPFFLFEGSLPSIRP